MKTDLSYLQEMSGGNQELVIEMINIFKNQVVEFARDMEDHLQKKEYELLTRTSPRRNKADFSRRRTEFAGQKTENRLRRETLVCRY